jgi:dihydroflavonol-4-reductase
MREFIEELATISGHRPPRFRMPLVLALGLAHADAFVAGRILGRPPRIPLEGVRTAREVMFANCQRAVRELGLPHTPVRDALAKAVRWFEEHPRRQVRGVS